jgi:hypothetical protein
LFTEKYLKIEIQDKIKRFNVIIMWRYILMHLEDCPFEHGGNDDDDLQLVEWLLDCGWIKCCWCLNFLINSLHVEGRWGFIEDVWCWWKFWGRFLIFLLDFWTLWRLGFEYVVRGLVWTIHIYMENIHSEISRHFDWIGWSMRPRIWGPTFEGVGLNPVLDSVFFHFYLDIIG